MIINSCIKSNKVHINWSLNKDSKYMNLEKNEI